MAKRLFDIVVSAAGLLVLSPLLLGMAALIWYGSGRPILYRGVRAGLNGREFRMLKFRTMVPDAEGKAPAPASGGEPIVRGGSTAENDPRLTPFGLWLRRYKLDELPQLVNVLTGDMSIVGPRPELPQYTSQYTGDELLILTVRPGITDYASIEFRQLQKLLGTEQPDLIYETKVRPVKNALRVKYVRERSFIEDLRIIFRTLHKIAFG